jgi:hypothetical protein
VRRRETADEAKKERSVTSQFEMWVSTQAGSVESAQFVGRVAINQERTST